MLHKDGKIAKTLTNDGMLAKVSVAVTLAAMIYIAAPYSGACFNPAVAIGLRVLCVNLTPASDPTLYSQCTEYTWLYVVATYSGGIVAGLVSHLHRCAGKEFTDIDCEEVPEIV